MLFWFESLERLKTGLASFPFFTPCTLRERLNIEYLVCPYTRASLMSFSASYSELFELPQGKFLYSPGSDQLALQRSYSPGFCWAGFYHISHGPWFKAAPFVQSPMFYASPYLSFSLVFYKPILYRYELSCSPNADRLKHRAIRTTVTTGQSKSAVNIYCCLLFSKVDEAVHVIRIIMTQVVFRYKL